jgi:hypothetical protein
MPANPHRDKVFISYSHHDAKWLERLRVRLKPLQRIHRVEIWDDTKLKPGSKWREEIANAIKSTAVAIPLISAEFLASDFIQKDELPPLLNAAEADGAVIIPVIIGPSRFLQVESLSRFQAVNSPLNPLIAMTEAEQEEVFNKLSEYLESLVLSQRKTPQLSTDHKPVFKYLKGRHPKTFIEELQASHAPPMLVSRILKAVATSFETNTTAANVRAYVMLPTTLNTLVVAYQYGMDGDSDSALELNVDAGVSGVTWSRKLPHLADMEKAETHYRVWNLTANQLRKIKKDRRAAISFPLFDLTKGPVDVAALELLGVFCIDTSTALTETGWIQSQIPPVLNKHVAQEGIEWADVLSVILKM